VLSALDAKRPENMDNRIPVKKNILVFIKMIFKKEKRIANAISASEGAENSRF